MPKRRPASPRVAPTSCRYGPDRPKWLGPFSGNTPAYLTGEVRPRPLPLERGDSLLSSARPPFRAHPGKQMDKLDERSYRCQRGCRCAFSGVGPGAQAHPASTSRHLLTPPDARAPPNRAQFAGDYGWDTVGLSSDPETFASASRFKMESIPFDTAARMRDPGLLGRIGRSVGVSVRIASAASPKMGASDIISIRSQLTSM